MFFYIFFSEHVTLKFNFSKKTCVSLHFFIDVCHVQIKSTLFFCSSCVLEIQKMCEITSDDMYNKTIEIKTAYIFS